MTGNASSPVSLTDDVTWISECYAYDDGTHEHVSVYLIRAGADYVLVDTGSFYHREAITDAITEATDGAGLDAIVLSHSDYPHSANVGAFREEWDDVEIVASSGVPAQQGLPERARKATIGEEMDVAGRRFGFVDPPLADRSHTAWIVDRDAEILFTADGFGNFHAPGECTATSRDLEGGIDFDDVLEHNRETLVWLRYVDPEKVGATLEAIVEEHDPRWIAPIHGNPIAAEDVDGHLDTIVRVAARIADEYDVPDA